MRRRCSGGSRRRAAPTDFETPHTAAEPSANNPAPNAIAAQGAQPPSRAASADSPIANTAAKPHNRSTNTEQPASMRPRACGLQRNALTTSPPIVDGRHRLKNSPSK
ncbi:MAG: hypothetical protein QM811_22715 [Pirellulales bacterium]